MSLGTFLRPRSVRRSPAPVSIALLDRDAGDLLTPAAYPYPAGASPLRPFAGRIVNPGRGPRPLMQLFPRSGNPSDRLMAHLDYAGRAQANRAGTRDVSGLRAAAKITRTRPWLFAGGSSATAGDRAAAGSSTAAASGPCEGCR